MIEGTIQRDCHHLYLRFFAAKNTRRTVYQLQCEVCAPEATGEASRASIPPPTGPCARPSAPWSRLVPRKKRRVAGRWGSDTIQDDADTTFRSIEFSPGVRT